MPLLLLDVAFLALLVSLPMIHLQCPGPEPIPWPVSRRDHGFERATLPVWEGNKVNPLAHWTFEECWTYLRKYEVPYHPLHDVGFSSLGDVQSTKKVPHENWFTYAGERSGRFEGMKAKDGSSKTECGIHSFDANSK